MRQTRRVVCAVLVVVLLPVLSGTAQEPAGVARRGVIDAVARREARVIISDTSYHFPATTPVYQYGPRRSERESWIRVARARLRPGMRVGYTVARANRVHGQQTLTGVWMLPRRGPR